MARDSVLKAYTENFMFRYSNPSQSATAAFLYSISLSSILLERSKSIEILIFI